MPTTARDGAPPEPVCTGTRSCSAPSSATIGPGSATTAIAKVCCLPMSGPSGRLLRGSGGLLMRCRGRYNDAVLTSKASQGCWMLTARACSWIESASLGSEIAGLLLALCEAAGAISRPSGTCSRGCCGFRSLGLAVGCPSNAGFC